MLSNWEHLPVNWIDGMKISRKNFIETDSFFQEQLQDVRNQQLTTLNYGILPAENSLDLSVFSDANQNITVELRSCKAVTSAGSRIEVSKSDGIQLKINFKDIIGRLGLKNVSTLQLFILIGIDPFKRIPVGQPLVDENPPRIPFTQPYIVLDIAPAEAVNQFQLGNMLIIGEINYENNELTYQRDFIPASASLDSLTLLQSWHKKFGQYLENWEQNCIRIIQKINLKTQQANSLTNSILQISEKILEKLVTQKTNYQWIISKSPPVYLYDQLLTNIQFIYTLIVCLPEKDREELLNYFAEWADVPTGNIQNITMKALEIQYVHNDIGNVMQEIQVSYQLYIKIFQKLASLDFIGKKKGQNIFVIEQEVKDIKPVTPPPQEKPSRWSPLS